jgi:Zn-dependent M16 (insulinase) family peptidase
MPAEGHGCWQKMIFRVKALHRNLADAVGIMADILASGDLSDENRMRDVIAEAKNRLHAAVIPSGHIFARMTAGAALSLPGLRDEQWHGRTQLQFVTRTAEGFREGKGELRERLSHLKDMLFRRDRMFLNLTADPEGLALFRHEVAALTAKLGNGNRIGGEVGLPNLHPTRAGIVIPAQVSYVAQVMAAPVYSDPLSAALYVAARNMSNGYLYKHIRVQGGAYGGMAQYDPLGGSFAFLSYRDPHIVETLQAYHDAVEDMAKNQMYEEELEKAIIGAIGALDRPMDPANRGYVAMIREMAGLTDERRQIFRDEIMGMTVESLQEAVIRYFAGAAKSAAVAVYAADGELARANETVQPALRVVPLLNNDQ